MGHAQTGGVLPACQMVVRSEPRHITNSGACFYPDFLSASFAVAMKEQTVAHRTPSRLSPPRDGFLRPSAMGRMPFHRIVV